PQWMGNPWLERLDHFFILVFLVEAIVKIQVLKPKAYFSNRWNQFDFAILLLSLPALLPAGQLPLVLVLRLFRLVRMVRFLRFVPRLKSILEGLNRAFKASVFVFLVLIFLNFLLSLLTCHFFRNAAPEYFGNPLISAYSIFQIFTVEGWNEIPHAVINSSSGPQSDLFIGLTRLYFVFVVLVGGIFGMSLANAIFVDEMTIDNNRDLEIKIDGLETQIRELKHLIKKQYPDG
ncbi:MAG: ion transporter, partial [Bacteroidetes bacterium]